MAEHDLQAGLIGAEKGIEAAFEQAVDAAMLLALRLEQARAHHRRQRQCDHQREQKRDADGDGEFTEQLADITAHEEERDEDGNERKRYRYDGEADLAGTLESGLHRRETR